MTDSTDNTRVPPANPGRSGALIGGGGWVVLALLALGIFFRVWQYLFNRSLWLDEAYLTSSVFTRNLNELLFLPLSNGQAAPLGFLTLVKGAVTLMGNTDWALRAVPLVSGLASLFVAWRLALRVFSHDAARWLFIALMACSPVLIYYSSEFKQYACDVLMGLIVLWAGARFTSGNAVRDSAVLALAGAVGVWLSHASVFVLAGVGTTLWLEWAHRKQLRPLLCVSAAGLVCLLSFGINYKVSLLSLSANPQLIGFWQMAYAPFPPTSLKHLFWYWESALSMVYLASQHLGIAHHGQMPGWFAPLNVGLLLLVLAGAVALVRTSGRVGSFVLLTVLAVLTASALHLYPFRSRLVLFLVPFVFLCLAALVERAWQQWPGTIARTAAALAGVALVAISLVPSAQKVVEPYNSHDTKGALAYLSSHRLPGDQIALSSWSEKAFRIYVPSHGLTDVKVHIFRETGNKSHDAYTMVKRLCGGSLSGRVWTVMTHRAGEQGKFLETLQSISPVLDTWNGDGAALALHDFRSASYCQKYAPDPSTAASGQTLK